MHRLQNTDRVWWYIQRESQDTLGRPLTTDECVAAVVIVAALTKMLADEPEPATSAPRPVPGEPDAARAAPRRQ